MSESATKAFLRPAKLFLLVLAFLLVYAGTLVALVPVGWLWQQAGGQVSLPPEIKVKQINGHLWEGVAGLVVADFPVRLDWSVGAPSLAKLALPTDFSISTLASSIQGEARFIWRDEVTVRAEGIIDVSEFEPLIRRSEGAIIEGNVVIDHLSIAWADQGLVRTEGLGRWDGGLVTWPMGNKRGSADFPPMRATLASTRDGISLAVSEQGGEGPAAAVDIRWNGMMDLRIYKRMVDLAQQPWPDSAKADDVVFRVRQAVVPAGVLR